MLFPLASEVFNGVKKKKGNKITLFSRLMLGPTFSQFWRFLRCVKQKAIGLYTGCKFPFYLSHRHKPT